MKTSGRRSARGVLSGQGSASSRPPRVPAKVVKLFKECGYLRTPPASKGNEEEHVGGHRGYEVRFMAHSREECQRIVRLLKACRIEAGKPFSKGQQWRIPVYGRELFVALRASK